MKLLFLLLAVGFTVADFHNEELPSLERANVFRIIPETEEQLSAILTHDGRSGYDILKYDSLRGDGILLMVTADHLKDFKAFLNEYEIKHVIVTENVQAAIDEEATSLRNAQTARTNGQISFTTYPSYDDMVVFMAQVASDHRDIATLIRIGTSSYENTVIYGLKISSGGTGKPAVLVEAGLHAREWITPTTVLYFINEFVRGASNTDLFEHVDWYFIPLINPDGYKFSQTKYRMWRKTRSVNVGSSCRGVDPNRNFDYHWMLNGASTNPCSDVFAGITPFSEKETQALRDFVLANNETIKLYLAYHSHGSYFLYPWGYTGELPDNEEELRTLAQAADDAQYTHRGMRYTIGTAYNALSPAAGGSDDWVKGVGGVGLSYTVELPTGGIFGFDIPPSEIIPVGQESLLALRVFGEYVAEKYGTSNQ